MRGARDSPPGGLPWDGATRFRIGAFVGGIGAAGLAFALGLESIWLVAGGAAVGGAIGYWSESDGRSSVG